MKRSIQGVLIIALFVFGVYVTAYCTCSADACTSRYTQLTDDPNEPDDGEMPEAVMWISDDPNEPDGGEMPEAVFGCGLRTLINDDPNDPNEPDDGETPEAA